MMAQKEKCLLHRHENLILYMHMRNCVLVGEVELGECQGLRASRFSLFSKLHSSERLCPRKQGARHWRISTWSWPLPPATCTHMCIHTRTRCMLHTRIVIVLSGGEDRNTRLWSCRVEVGIDFVLFTYSWETGKKKKTSVFLEKSLKRLL